MNVELINEPCYTFGSADNTRRYQSEVLLGDRRTKTINHGIIIDGEPMVVVRVSGGATGIHENSLLRLGDTIYFAVSAYVCRLTLGNSVLDWSLKTDWATCFGVYYSEKHDALISHGELSIVRFSTEGEKLWDTDGCDIFTEGFSLEDDCIRAVDFNHQAYRFDYDAGH